MQASLPNEPQESTDQPADPPRIDWRITGGRRDWEMRLPGDKSDASDWITGMSTLGWEGGFNVKPPPAGINTSGGGVESFFPLSAIFFNAFEHVNTLVKKPEVMIKTGSRGTVF